MTSTCERRGLSHAKSWRNPPSVDCMLPRRGLFTCVAAASFTFFIEQNRARRMYITRRCSGWRKHGGTINRLCGVHIGWFNAHHRVSSISLYIRGIIGCWACASVARESRRRPRQVYSKSSRTMPECNIRWQMAQFRQFYESTRIRKSDSLTVDRYNCSRLMPLESPSWSKICRVPKSNCTRLQTDIAFDRWTTNRRLTDDFRFLGGVSKR